jgi:hypothetical protein
VCPVKAAHAVYSFGSKVKRCLNLRIALMNSERSC